MATFDSFRVETLLFASEKGSLQCASEDNCRHCLPPPSVNPRITILH